LSVKCQLWPRFRVRNSTITIVTPGEDSILDTGTGQLEKGSQKPSQSASASAIKKKNVDYHLLETELKNKILDQFEL
jgi:hypothetical protein